MELGPATGPRFIFAGTELLTESVSAVPADQQLHQLHDVILTLQITSASRLALLPEGRMRFACAGCHSSAVGFLGSPRSSAWLRSAEFFCAVQGVQCS